jgi:hypothetical protein
MAYFAPFSCIRVIFELKLIKKYRNVIGVKHEAVPWAAFVCNHIQWAAPRHSKAWQTNSWRRQYMIPECYYRSTYLLCNVVMRYSARVYTLRPRYRMQHQRFSECVPKQLVLRTFRRCNQKATQNQKIQNCAYCCNWTTW